MRMGMMLGFPILASVIILIAALHTASFSITEFAAVYTANAQSATNTAKMHLEEGLKMLKTGDKDSAMTHLSAAQAAMGGASSNAKMHFEEGMKALQAGDTNGAIMHLTAADQALQ